MLVAKIVDGAIADIQDYRKMFPNVSFPRTGPDEQFMTDNSLMYVHVSKPHNPMTHKIYPATPYIEDGKVYTVVANELSPEVQAEYEQRRKQQKIADFTAEAGRRLDEFAIARGYGSIISVCTYDTSAVPRFAADAVRARNLRDQWWAVLNQIIAEVNAGTRAEPDTFDDIAGELPVLTWE